MRIIVLVLVLGMSVLSAWGCATDSEEGKDSVQTDLVGQDGLMLDTAEGQDTANGEDTNPGNDTAAPTSCVLTVANYIDMTRFVELTNDDNSCKVSFTVADKVDGVVDWDGIVKQGDVLQVIEGWASDNEHAMVEFPCDGAPMGKCYAMEGTVTLTTFELTAADAQEGGSPDGKKVAGDVDVKATRQGNEGSAVFSFDLAF